MGLPETLHLFALKYVFTCSIHTRLRFT